MRASYYLHLAVTFIFAFLLIALGFFCIFLPRAPLFLQNVVEFISSKSVLVYFVGIGLLAIGFILLVTSFLTRLRDHVLVVYEKKGQISIDQEVLQQYVKSYFSVLFSEDEFFVETRLKKGKIHLAVDITAVPKQSQKILLESIESDLSKLFDEKFGYRDDFHLNISFA
jgi:hypothetical protein